MKKEEDYSLKDFFRDHGIYLRARLGTNIADYIKELNEMQNDHLPHYGEELLSLVFVLQQQVVDMQAKLTRYIKSQHNIISLNYYINKEKVFESYTYIMFELRKFILFIKNYDFEVLELEEKLANKILILREFINMNNNVINNPKALVNDSLLIKLNILQRQCKMLEDNLSLLVSNTQKRNDSVNEYNNLYKKYEDLTTKYYVMNSNTLGSKNKSDQYLERQLKQGDYSLIQVSNCVPFRKKQQKIIALKVASSINVENIIDIIKDEQNLKLFATFCLLKNNLYGIHSTPDGLIESLFNVDTMNIKSPNLGQILKDDYDEIKNIYNYYNSSGLKRSCKMAYIQCLVYSLSRKSLNTLFNHVKTRIIFRAILHEYRNFDSGKYDETSDLSNEGINALLSLPDANKGEIVIPKNLFDDFFSKNFNERYDNEITVDNIKIWLLDNCFKSFSDYLGINYDSNNLNIDDNHVKETMDVIDKHYIYSWFRHHDFTLTDSITCSFYMIFYLSFITNKIYSKRHNYGERLFLSVLTKIRDIYQEFDDSKKIHLIRMMQKLFATDEMTALLEKADEIPEKDSKITAYYRLIVGDKGFLTQSCYYSNLDIAMEKVIDHFTEKRNTENRKKLIK